MSFVWRRFLGTVPTLFGIVVITFMLSHALPGEPAAYFAGPAANAESIAQIRASLGLDKSLPKQFLKYASDLAHGDLGTPLTTGQPVLIDLATRLPVSIELTLCALLFAVGIAIPMGLLAATRPDSALDHFCRGTITVSSAFPTFFVGLLLMYIFYFLLDWSPQPVGRLNEMLYSPPARARDWRLSRSQRHRRAIQSLHGVARTAHPAFDLAGTLRARTDRAHHAGIDACRAECRLHAYRTRGWIEWPHHSDDLRVSQRLATHREYSRLGV